MLLELYLNIEPVLKDSLYTANDIQKLLSENSNDNKSLFDTIFQIIVMFILGSGGVWQFYQYLVKRRELIKEKNDLARIERENKEQEHSNNLETEMFKFDKEKYLNIRSDNQKFQNDIISEIFNKFVEQGQWISSLHDKSIETIARQMNEVHKSVNEMYVQNDNLTGRIRQVEDRFIKNSNNIEGKLDTLIKLLSNLKILDNKELDKNISNLIEVLSKLNNQLSDSD